MKNKIIIGVIALSLFFPPAFSLAQTTTNLQNQYMQALQALINLLIQRVNLLMDELARMKLGQIEPTSTPTSIPEYPEPLPTIFLYPTYEPNQYPPTEQPTLSPTPAPTPLLNIYAPDSKIVETRGRSSQELYFQLTNEGNSSLNITGIKLKFTLGQVMIRDKTTLEIANDYYGKVYVMVSPNNYFKDLVDQDLSEGVILDISFPQRMFLNAGQTGKMTFLFLNLGGGITGTGTLRCEIQEVYTDHPLTQVTGLPAVVDVRK